MKQLKLAAVLFALWLCVGFAYGQFTSVTATITDSDSQTWNNGKWTATLYNPYPANQPSIGGVPLTASQLNLSGSMSGSGVLTGSFADNNQVSPSGTSWQFIITPNASAQSSPASTPITGSTENLSTQLSSQLRQLRFPAAPTAYGYLDAEINPIPVPGGQYFNVTSQLNRIWNGSAWQNGGGGPATLPTATAPGQIISSTAAGTTYAVQGQVFYSQTGDTISSIETECSSACTYVVTVPQTITLTGNHTLNANVQLQFAADGEWTVNGAYTLTIPGNVTGTLNQHFAGSSTITGLNGKVPVEWFGGVGYSTYAAAVAGSSSQTALVAALASLNQGCVLLQPLGYQVTTTLIITKGATGFCGVNQTPGLPAGAGWSTMGAAVVSTSASADIIDCAPGSGYYTQNTFTDFSIFRGVQPTGTANGLYMNGCGGYIIDHVHSSDSIYPFHFHNAPGFGIGAITNTEAEWGQNGFSAPTVQAYGYYVDSLDGTGTGTINFENAGCATPSPPSTVPICMEIKGSQIRDVTVNFLGSPNMQGLDVTNTSGSPGYINGDIFLDQLIFDTIPSTVPGISFNNVTNVTGGKNEVSNVYVVGGNCSIKVTNSTGISFSNVQQHGAGGSPGVGMCLSGSSYITGINESFDNNGTTGMTFASTSSYNNFVNTRFASNPTDGFTFDSLSADNYMGQDTYLSNGTNHVDSNGTNTIIDATANTFPLGINTAGITSTAAVNVSIPGSASLSPASFFEPSLATGNHSCIPVGIAVAPNEASFYCFYNTTIPFGDFETYAAGNPFRINGSYLFLEGGPVAIGSGFTGASLPSLPGLFNVGTASQFYVSSTGATVNSGAPATTASGQISYSGTVATASNCNQSGTLTSVTGCLEITAGSSSIHYIPIF